MFNDVILEENIFAFYNQDIKYMYIDMYIFPSQISQANWGVSQMSALVVKNPNAMQGDTRDEVQSGSRKIP